MKKIQKLLREVMRTPGPIRVQLLLLTTLTVSSVTSTVLQICNRANNISGESTLHTFKREIISLHTTLGKVNYEETRQLFLNNVLTESTDDGQPAFYNSNILGRYMRKDYFGG